MLWGARKGEGWQDFWCQEPSTAVALLGIRFYYTPVISSSRGLQPTLFAFKESTGSFNCKQLGDALRVAFKGTLATTVPFSCCCWLLVLRLVELVTDASKGLSNKARSAKNSQETLLLCKKSNNQLPAWFGWWARQLLSGRLLIFVGSPSGISKAERN